jgi:hypothetical protein
MSTTNTQRFISVVNGSVSKIFGKAKDAQAFVDTYNTVEAYAYDSTQGRTVWANAIGRKNGIIIDANFTKL